MEIKKDQLIKGISTLTSGLLLSLGCSEVQPPPVPPEEDIFVPARISILTPDIYFQLTKERLDEDGFDQWRFNRFGGHLAARGTVLTDGLPITQNASQSGITAYKRNGEEIQWIAELELQNQKGPTIERFGLLYPPELINDTLQEPGEIGRVPNWNPIFLTSAFGYTYESRPALILLYRNEERFVGDISFVSPEDVLLDLPAFRPGFLRYELINDTPLPVNACLPSSSRWQEWVKQTKDYEGFGWPAYGPVFTYFSQWHQGIDISPPFGFPVFASRDGIVLLTRDDNYGLGRHIVLVHPSEFLTVYGHLSLVLVKPGLDVEKGDMIGCVGSTGLSTGTHVHFEILKDGRKVNPLNYLP